MARAQISCNSKNVSFAVRRLKSAFIIVLYIQLLSSIVHIYVIIFPRNLLDIGQFGNINICNTSYVLNIPRSDIMSVISWFFSTDMRLNEVLRNYFGFFVNLMHLFSCLSSIDIPVSLPQMAKKRELRHVSSDSRLYVNGRVSRNNN